MPHVAFVTYAGLPELSADDRLAADALRRLGARVESVVWDAHGIPWSLFDAIVVRSCWDYHVRPMEFRAWLDDVERSGAPLWNPAPLLRWNMEKTYLRELEARGVPVVPTQWVERGTEPSLGALLAREGWSDAVVKPVLSASAHETWRTGVSEAAEDEERFRGLLARGDVMVQPFVGAVRDEGEWSLLFFGGVFSHAVVKRPANGDFRVQESFGGVARQEHPQPGLLAEAQAVVDLVSRPWLYARVDGCVVDGRFLLMELEMLEPSLFLASDPRGAARFAEAILAVGESRGVR
jgi:glutathione synthase/RimK-type ligase-like ATP-grasp enzyme